MIGGALSVISTKQLWTLIDKDYLDIIEDKILENFLAFQKAVSMLDCKIHFAVKANSSIAILYLLGKAGSGADIVSGGELQRALAANIKASDIIFSGVGSWRTRDSACGVSTTGAYGAGRISLCRRSGETLSGQVASVGKVCRGGRGAGGAGSSGVGRHDQTGQSSSGDASDCPLEVW